MRRYEINITDQDGAPKTLSDPQGLYNFDGTFKSMGTNNVTNQGALNIELDCNVSVYNAPMGGSYVRIWGIGLPFIKQIADFNPQIDATTGTWQKYCNIEISAGMAPNSYPLANPSQYKPIVKGVIQQAFGNWQGTSQSIDFVIVPPVGNSMFPKNIQFDCKKDKKLSDALTLTLATAFKDLPGTTINVNISDELVAPEDIVKTCTTLEELAKFLSQKSKSIIKDVKYPGIQISYQNDEVSAYDYTKGSTSAKVTQINFNDLIGQPTWIKPYTLVMKTVIRGDLVLGQKILMPQESAKRGLILTQPGSMSQYKDTVSFEGEFYVSQLRHTGIYRQPSADSWVTIIQASRIPT